MPAAVSTCVRWMLIAIAGAGCPSTDDDMPIMEDPAPPPEMSPSDEPPRHTTCSLGIAPKATYCRETREGRSAGTTKQSSHDALFVQDWTNTSADAAGHSESTYGAGGWVVERHETGTFTSDMVMLCGLDSEFSIETGTRGVIRTTYAYGHRVTGTEWNQGGVITRVFNNYAEGKLTRTFGDTGPNTPVAYTYLYFYDEHGRVDRVFGDHDGDGEVDDIQQRVWDDLGREIAQITFVHGEEIERWTWTYDDTRLAVTEKTGLDPYRWTNRYDDRGRMIGVDYFDPIAQHLDMRSTYTYDEHDRRILYVEDDDADGTIEQTVTWDHCDE